MRKTVSDNVVSRMPGAPLPLQGVGPRHAAPHSCLYPRWARRIYQPAEEVDARHPGQEKCKKAEREAMNNRLSCFRNRILCHRAAPGSFDLTQNSGANQSGTSAMGSAVPAGWLRLPRRLRQGPVRLRFCPKFLLQAIGSQRLAPLPKRIQTPFRSLGVFSETRFFAFR